jgi:hypothetical protein
MARKPTQTPGGAEPSAVVTAAAVVAPTLTEPGSLPNAIDVDARFIRGPVLTNQGYVVPDEGWQKANPAAFQAGLKAQG